MTKKTCTKCLKTKPVNEFYCRNLKPIAQCKTCCIEKQTFLTKVNKQRLFVCIPITQRCGRCQTEKSCQEFCINYGRKSGLGWLCKTCDADNSRQSRERNKKSLRNTKDKLCPKCGERKLASEFYADKTNASGLCSVCSKCFKIARKNYCKNNPEKITELTKRREARKLQRLPSWANMTKIKEIYHNKPDGMHVDHVLPLQGKLISGFHVENNLQYLSAAENVRKRNNFVPYREVNGQIVEYYN